MKKLTILLIGALFQVAAAQAASDTPLRIVVPYGPGGGSDNLARLIAPKMSESLGQPVIIENKGGAATQLGTQDVVRSNPDGNTILLVDTAFTTNPSLYRKLPYDSARDLAPVALLATAPVILVVHPSVPAKNLKELIALGKTKPLQNAIAGPGGATALGAQLFGSLAGVKIEEIPYKGAGPALNDLVGGHVMMTVTGISSVKPHVDTGKLRAIAVTGEKRAPSLPNVPTFAEAGLAGVEASTYWGALVPAATPRATIDRLNRAMTLALKSPDIQAKLTELGFIPIGGTADEYRANIQRETARWQTVIKSAGVKMED